MKTLITFCKKVPSAQRMFCLKVQKFPILRVWIPSTSHQRKKKKQDRCPAVTETSQASSRRGFVREFAPSDKLPTGKDGAILRTLF